MDPNESIEINISMAFFVVVVGRINKSKQNNARQKTKTKQNKTNKQPKKRETVI